MLPHLHCLGLSRSRTQFLATVCLATVLVNLLTKPVSANGIIAYRASGSLVFKTDDTSVSNAHGATLGRIKGAARPEDPAAAFLALLLLGVM